MKVLLCFYTIFQQSFCTAVFHKYISFQKVEIVLTFKMYRNFIHCRCGLRTADVDAYRVWTGLCCANFINRCRIFFLKGLQRCFGVQSLIGRKSKINFSFSHSCGSQIDVWLHLTRLAVENYVQMHRRRQGEHM